MGNSLSKNLFLEPLDKKLVTNTMNTSDKNMDTNASSRKEDHIKLAFDSVVKNVDVRFSYEPILRSHPTGEETFPLLIGEKKMSFPLWISSMTGGTERAKSINKNLAIACNKFGLGMGLGSCRQLLYSEDRLDEFAVRSLMPDAPLFVNLGIAQIESLIEKNHVDRIGTLINRLEADGLIVHVNPLQEWMQPEGDTIRRAPIESISNLVKQVDYPIIVKEVGQGMGYESLLKLMKLPLEAIEFGAHGGTNFTKLELFRADENRKKVYESVGKLGHSAIEMLESCNKIFSSNDHVIQCKNVIISGGIKGFLDGYYLVSNSKMPAMYAQGSAMLEYAIQGSEALNQYIEMQLDGYRMAHAMLTARNLENRI